MLKLKDRILLDSGISLVPDKVAAEIIVNKGCLPNHIKVLESEASKKYDIMYRESVGFNEAECLPIEPRIRQPSEKELCEVLSIFSERRDETPQEQHDARVSLEIQFFSDKELMAFLFSCHHLIKRFREDNVVWGVGRGSACASYILFLLGVHDVNPIKYKISFSEFSKEMI